MLRRAKRAKRWTTASDFVRFLLAMFEGFRLKPESAQQWLRSNVEVRHQGSECLGPSDGDVATGVAWGLGWGLEPAEGTFFHWGDIGAHKAFTIGAIQDRDALVIFTNGEAGFSIMPELAAHFMPGDRPSLAWLGYARHNSPPRRLLRAARMLGIEVVWQEIEDAKLDADDLRWIAQGLGAASREADRLWLLARIEERSPADHRKQDGKG
jgi:hypothetical protein